MSDNILIYRRLLVSTALLPACCMRVQESSVENLFLRNGPAQAETIVTESAVGVKTSAFGSSGVDGTVGIAAATFHTGRA